MEKLDIKACSQNGKPFALKLMMMIVKIMMMMVKVIYKIG